MDLRKGFFTERVIRHENRLPRGVIESPSLEVFQRHVVVSLRDVILWSAWQCWVNSWTDDLRGFFQPKQFYDSVPSPALEKKESHAVAGDGE